MRSLSIVWLGINGRVIMSLVWFFCSSRRRHTRGALVTGVQMCALPILRPSIDPATGAPWGDVAWGGERDVDRAVAAAKQAFEGPWRKIPTWERAALLRKFADLYATRVDALAEIETRDNGRAVRESRGDTGMPAQYYTWYECGRAHVRTTVTNE